MNVLLSSAGRRGALVKIIRQALGGRGRVYAVDSGRWSAACRLADGWEVVPGCDDPGFADRLLEVCLRYRVALVIPTIDPELPILAANRERFAAHGVQLAVSGPLTAGIACDKLATNDFCVQHGLPVAQLIAHGAEGLPRQAAFPVVVKPRCGSGSAGVRVAHDAEELKFYFARCKDPIVQALAPGREFTVNFFIGRNKECLAAVPHWRVETRGGEVSKGVTVKEPRLMELAGVIAARLPDPWGPMCYQAFLDEHGAIRIVELNARFGGGYPLAHHAGADFVQMLLADAAGEKPAPCPAWRAGVTMTRWDEAVFAAGEDMDL